jgi:hypothetical protein
LSEKDFAFIDFFWGSIYIPCMNLRKKFFFALFAAVALVFSGCAATSSGSPLGEAAALKYSDGKDKLHFVDMGVVIAGAGEKNKVSSPHHENEISGVAVASNISLLSFDYQLMRQKGGLFLSVPFTIPLDIGVRPSIVQWVGPFYFGAGTSFVVGYYTNDQKESYEPKKDDSNGRFDGFILYNVGGGTLFDVTETFAIGAYANYERIALNSGGSNSTSGDFVNFGAPDENLPPYAVRGNVMTFGVDFFIKTKTPFGMYFEYAPEDLPMNHGWSKIKLGGMLLY